MNTSRWLGLILILFIALGTIYAVVTPVFEASDELWHYPMIRHLADGNPLPAQVFDPAAAGPWKQEASQPPLYYYLGALLTFWIDTSDMEAVRHLNPHVDNGLITADGNINLAIHHPGVNPWQGTMLAVRIVRVVSVLLGAATVALTFRIGIEVVPKRPEIALSAAAINAFMPMFLFISGAVNNDNLAVPLASLALLLMIKGVEGERPAAFWLALGGVVGLALLTKEGTFALIPLAWGTIFIRQWRAGRTVRETGEGPVALRDFLRPLGATLLPFAAVMVPVLLVAGWWYLRNLRLYGDLLGWNAFIAVLGQRSQPASLAQLWDERTGFLMSYWGLFGGVNVPMWPWIYGVLNGILLIGVGGFLFYVLGRMRGFRRGIGRGPVGLMARTIDVVDRNFALALCLLFVAAVVFGLVQWATTTWSSQGRLVFTAISALNVLLAVGLWAWLPQRLSRIGAFISGGLMLLLATAAPFLWIAPAYRPETYLEFDRPKLNAVDVTFHEPGGDGEIRLTGYAVEGLTSAASEMVPGEQLDVILAWEVASTLGRDWSTFVHLTDPVLEHPVAQRDMYPAQGLRAASALERGERLLNYYRLEIPETAVAPAELDVVAGFYDYPTGERLQTSPGIDSLILESVSLRPRPGEYPNAASVNFGDELELVGFGLAPRRVVAGEEIQLTVYFKKLRPSESDYTLFAQVVDEDTTRWASADLLPAGGTSGWEIDRVYELEMPLRLAEETPAGVYPIHVGAYTRTSDGGFTRLQLVSQDGRITQEDFLLLARVRVD